jgi:hypothetical protein
MQRPSGASSVRSPAILPAGFFAQKTCSFRECAAPTTKTPYCYRTANIIDSLTAMSTIYMTAYRFCGLQVSPLRALRLSVLGPHVAI